MGYSVDEDVARGRNPKGGKRVLDFSFSGCEGYWFFRSDVCIQGCGTVITLSDFLVN